MEEQEIDRALSEAEQTVERERRPDLKRTGFWRAVTAVKRRPELARLHAARIARIDRRAFEKSVPLRVPATAGLLLDLGGAAVGVTLISFAAPLAVIAIFPPPELPFWATSPGREVVFLAGLAALLGTTHTLAHWVVGTLAGIRFTHMFIALPMPQPGFKIDYASYLRTPARARAWMHASGAIVTKVVPFALLPIAVADSLEPWAIWATVAIGVAAIVTDVLFSVRASDWKKFRREMRLA